MCLAEPHTCTSSAVARAREIRRRRASGRTSRAPSSRPRSHSPTTTSVGVVRGHVAMRGRATSNTAARRARWNISASIEPSVPRTRANQFRPISTNSPKCLVVDEARGSRTKPTSTLPHRILRGGYLGAIRRARSDRREHRLARRRARGEWSFEYLATQVSAAAGWPTSSRRESTSLTSLDRTVAGRAVALRSHVRAGDRRVSTNTRHHADSGRSSNPKSKAAMHIRRALRCFTRLTTEQYMPAR